jgi:hypothetical protein
MKLAVHNNFKDSFPKKKLVNKDVKQIKQSFKDVYTYIGISLILPDMYTNAHARTHTHTLQIPSMK